MRVVIDTNRYVDFARGDAERDVGNGADPAGGGGKLDGERTDVEAHGEMIEMKGEKRNS